MRQLVNKMRQLVNKGRPDVPPQLRTADAAWRSVPEHTLIGAHSAFVKLRTLIERLAVNDATVLITGESGSGKEVVAREIHMLSARGVHNFVPFNCAAIPHEL